jgi:hypothetical protein
MSKPTFPNPEHADFIGRVRSTNTTEELLEKYRDLCGALVIAAEEKRWPGKQGEDAITNQIAQWLIEAQQRQVLAMMPKDGKVH